MTTPEIEKQIEEIQATLALSKCLNDRAVRLIAETEAAIDRGETLAPVLTLVKS
ncbi:MAG: hypothetical protein ABSC36_04990 [Gaiellaceae bacterium]|jgi:hypothetical protein